MKMNVYFLSTLLFLPVLIQGTSLLDKIPPRIPPPPKVQVPEGNGEPSDIRIPPPPPFIQLPPIEVQVPEGKGEIGDLPFTRPPPFFPPPVKKQDDDRNCVDKVLNCQDFLVFCRYNDINSFMKENCQKSCGLCEKDVVIAKPAYQGIITVPAHSTTTSKPATTPLPGTTKVPNGFENFNGRIIRRTVISDEKATWHDAMVSCHMYGSEPFIPYTKDEYDLYKTVRHSLAIASIFGEMWLPANDRLEEGTLRWYNGQVASNISMWDWWGGEEMAGNCETCDCLYYGGGPFNPGVYLVTCTPDAIAYPPICEIL